MVQYRSHLDNGAGYRHTAARHRDHDRMMAVMTGFMTGSSPVVGS